MPIISVGQIASKNTAQMVAADLPNKEMPVSLNLVGTQAATRITDVFCSRARFFPR